MLKRLLTAIPLLLIVSLAFVLPGLGGNIFFFIMAMGMVMAGAYECLVMLDVPYRKTYLALIGICTAAYLINAWIYSPPQDLSLVIAQGSEDRISAGMIHSYLLDILIICFFLLATSFVVFKKGCTKLTVQSALTAVGILIYVSWSLQFMAKIYYADWNFVWDHTRYTVTGRNLLIFLIAVAKMADVGAYIFGSLTKKLPGGNHKLALTISPQKSYEGLLGGILFSVGTAMALAKIPDFILFNGQPAFTMAELVFLGIVAAVVGLLGDLAESAIKRAGNFKDSGHLPGIGGILDVLDSLIPLAPLFYAYVLITLSQVVWR